MVDVYFYCLYTKRLLFVYFSFSFDLVFDFVFRLNCIIIVMLSCSRNILDLETMIYVMLLCYVILCYVMLCYVILCYVMLYYVMLCYAM